MKCDDCDLRFNIKQNLEHHRLIHVVKFDGNKIIRCPICCCTFRRHIVFRRHILVRHLIDDDFKCVECAETFQTKSKLEIHKLVHLARFERRKLRKLKKTQLQIQRTELNSKTDSVDENVEAGSPQQDTPQKETVQSESPEQVQNPWEKASEKIEKIKSVSVSRPKQPVGLDTNAVLEKLNRLKSQLNSAESRRDPLPNSTSLFSQNTTNITNTNSTQFPIPIEFSPFQSFHTNSVAFPTNSTSTNKKVKKVRKRTQRLVVPGPLMGPINENWKNFQFPMNQIATQAPMPPAQPMISTNSGQYEHFHHNPVQQMPVQMPHSPFICQYCGRGFKKQKYLRFHLNSHAGYRPHMCNICGKSFGRTSILIKHKNTVHNKNFMPKYTCGQCCKQFVRKDMYQRHLLTHSHYRPWSCPYCHLHFKTKQTCAKHIKIHQTSSENVIDRNDGSIIGPMTQLLNQPSASHQWAQPPPGHHQEVDIPYEHNASSIQPQRINPSQQIDTDDFRFNNGNQQPVQDPFHSLTDLVFDPPSGQSQNHQPLINEFENSQTKEIDTPVIYDSRMGSMRTNTGDPVLLTETTSSDQIAVGTSNGKLPSSNEKSSEKSSKKTKSRAKTKKSAKAKVSEKPAKKVPKEILVSEGDIEELASIKEVQRNDSVSLSEKYLIDCSKERITGKRSRISNQELNEEHRGRYVCNECNKSYSRSNDLKEKVVITNEVKWGASSRWSSGLRAKATSG